MPRSSILVAIAVSLAASGARAEPAGAGWRLEVETSPQFFVLKGAQLGASLRASGHLGVQAGAFTLVLPQLFLGENQDEGWDVRHVGAYAGPKYFLRTGNGGAFGSLLAVAQRHSYARAGGEDTYIELNVAAQVAYQWFPSRRASIYIAPSLTVAVPFYRSDEPMVGGTRFEQKPVNVIPILYTGYQF